MRQNIVIAKSRYNRNAELFVEGSIFVTKDLFEFCDQYSIRREHLLLATWMTLVVVMPCGIACPDDEIDLIFYVVFDPLECRIDQCPWGVAIAGFGSIQSCRSMVPVAGGVFVRSRVDLVKGVRMNVCRRLDRCHGLASGESTC